MTQWYEDCLSDFIVILPWLLILVVDLLVSFYLVFQKEALQQSHVELFLASRLLYRAALEY